MANFNRKKKIAFVKRKHSDDHPDKKQQPHWRSSNGNCLVKAVAALDAYSVDGIMAQWNPDGVYDNPMVGPPARGLVQLRRAMVDLVDLLESKNTHLQVNRVTEGGGDSNNDHCVVEWTPVPADGREGLHIAKFDEDGYLQHVRVYVRKAYEDDDDEEIDETEEEDDSYLSDEEQPQDQDIGDSYGRCNRRHNRRLMFSDPPGGKFRQASRRFNEEFSVEDP